MLSSKIPLTACAAAGLFSCILAPQSKAQLAASGTPGDRAVYTIGAVGVIDDVTALPSLTLTHDFDTETIADTANSFELGAEGGADDTKIFLTAGHHLVIYGQEWDGGGERSGADSYLKIDGTKIPFGHSSAYTRDATTRESFTRGGTILNVTQGQALELESQRLDVFQNAADIGIRPLTMQNADVQLIKLDDANLTFLRLSAVSNPSLIAASGSGPANVPYDFQDEIDAATFGHSTTVANDEIVLKEVGHYLIFANTGTTIAVGNQRNNLTQKLFLDDDGAGANPPVAITGGATTSFLRHASAGDGAGGLIDDGALSVGVLVEVTVANSVLTVEITRDSAGSSSTVALDQTRTGLAIAKLPSYGDYISLGESGATNNMDINPAVASARSFASNSDVTTNDSFGYVSGTSASQIVVKKANDLLFLSSHYVDDYNAPGEVRTVVKQGFQTTTGGAVGYGAGGVYNRDNQTANQRGRDSGDWAGAILLGSDVTVGGGVETTTARLGGGAVQAPTGLSFQAINIASISIPPSNDPIIAVNNALNINTNSLGTIITDEANLLTEDDNTAAAGLTYTIDTAITGGTLKLGGAPLIMGSTFTQDDVNNDMLTFDGGTSEVVGGFDFTVSDGGALPASGTFVINVTFPVANITIAGDGNVGEGSTAGWTITSTAIPPDGSITVNLAYSGGSATAGSDYTSGPASIDIAMGMTTADLDLATLMDGIAEGSELINVSIISVSTTASVTAATGSPSSARVTILDGNAAPTATNTTHVVVGTGTVPLDDIVVTDDDDAETSLETGTVAMFEFTGATNVTVFDSALVKPDDDSSFTLTPALTAAAGFQIEIVATPAASDLTGSVQLWEIGGTSNGSGVYLVDGVPHLMVKANGTAGDSPTDSGDPGFVDLDWEPDDNIVVPLSSGSLEAGSANTIALVMDISGNIVTYSVNDVPASTANLSPQTGLNFVGDHTVNIGVGAGTGSGGTNDGSGTFASLTVTNPTGGSASIDSVRFWNEATGTTTKTSAVADDVTVTLTVDNALNGTLTATNGGGAATVVGSGTALLTITGSSVDVSTALATVDFVTNGSTTSIETISVSVDDGDEDGGGTLTGTIAVTDSVADPIYVDDDFSGSIGDAIADADGGPPVSPANFGVSAFANMADALAAVQPTGTIIINDGDYSAENITMADSVTLRLTATAGPVQIGNVIGVMTNSIDLQSNTLEVGATNVSTGGNAAAISGAGNLIKVGTGRYTIHAPATYTGTTTVLDGFLRIGQNVPLNPSLQSALDGDGPVVVTAPGRLEYVIAVDVSINQTGMISGTGVVDTLGDGTLIFDGAAANTFSGGFDLGDASSSTFDGTNGVKAGFVVVNHNGHLGTGLVLSRGGQLQAGTTGIVIPNDIDITAGGFRIGGSSDFSFGGNVNPIGGSDRGYGNYGLEGLDLTITGNIDLSGGNLVPEGAQAKDNGTWTFTGDISGTGNILVQNSFDDGEVTFSGINTYTGTTEFRAGITHYNSTHTGGGAYLVDTAGATLAGTGSTDSALTVNSGTTLSPGGSGTVGTFTTGALTINAGGIFQADLAGDQVVANGLVTVTGATLDLGFNPDPAANPITIITNNDTGPVVGEFTGFAEGVAVDPASVGWNGSVTYLQGGNDVAVTAVSVIAQWRIDFYGDSANSGPGADSATATNGLTNLQNFAFDLDPTAAASVLDVDEGAGTITTLGPPVIWIDPASSRIYLRYTRRSDSAVIPLTITAQFSRNMAAFEDSVGAPAVIATGTGDSGVAIEAVQTEFPFILPVNGGKARFGLVEVTTP